MTYSELTRRYFETAPRAGRLSVASRGMAGHRSEGTWVQFDLLIEAGSIIDARFLVFGCPHTIAAAACLAEQSIGAAAGLDAPLSSAALRHRLDVPVEKLGRLLIVEDAWKAAIGAAIDSGALAPISTHSY